MAKKQHYTYVIEVDEPLWPRKLADELDYILGDHVISVTDLQNAGHIYGATYELREEQEKPRPAFPRFGLLPALG